MKKKKKKLLENIFQIVSIAFIIGCFIFYGCRLVKYYKVFNPKKTEKNSGLLSIAIPKNSSIVTSGDGLYHIGGSYIYKGKVKNNYILFNGLTYRILKINYGSTVEIILDNEINEFSYSDTLVSYDKSSINTYLNKVFIKNVNKDLMEKSSVCLDRVNDIKSINDKCQKAYSDLYIKTLDINTYLNTLNNNETYLNENNKDIWLSNINDSMVWYISGSNISTSQASDTHKIKPIVTLNMDTELISGKGTKDDPYRIDATKDYHIGSYIKLDNDLYRVIDSSNDLLKLELNKPLDKLMAYGNNTIYDENNANSVASYLNKEYLNSLSYKNLIVKADYSFELYDGKLNDGSSKVKAFVGLPTIFDYQFNDDNNEFFLANYDEDNNIYVYSNHVGKVKSTLSKAIKPVITIKRNSLTSGKGTLESPYTKENK